MADDGFTLDYTAFDKALVTALSQSKRDPIVFVKEQAKGVVKRLVGITPPAHIAGTNIADIDGNAVWNVVQGGEAKRHGMALVRSDIAKIYGTPAMAYDLMKEKESHAGQAKGFWKLFKAGDLDRAKDIFRMVTGEGFTAFDDGTLHKARRNNRGRVGRVRKGRPLYYVNNPADIKSYTKKKSDMVGWLAAGWNTAAAMLGLQSPAWISRHSAPGRGSIVVTDEGLRITLTNAVSFAREINDWERRVQYALAGQAAAMARRSEDYLKKLFRDQGFKVAA